MRLHGGWKGWGAGPGSRCSRAVGRGGAWLGGGSGQAHIYVRIRRASRRFLQIQQALVGCSAGGIKTSLIPDDSAGRAERPHLVQRLAKTPAALRARTAMVRAAKHYQYCGGEEGWQSDGQ